MSDDSEISWTDATLNIVTGCTKVSPGCDHCYIDRTPPFRMAHRKFSRPGVGGTTGVTLHPDRLGQPYRWRKPRRIFVCSLADLFHDAVPDDLITDLWSVMATTPRHAYQILTKRPARMRSILTAPDFREKVARRGAARMEDGDNWFDYLTFEAKAWPLPNVWGGVTAEDQPRADQRIPILLDTPLAVRWVSLEPLLGPIDMHGPMDRYGHRSKLNYWLPPGRPYFPDPAPGEVLSGPLTEAPALDWVVLGGESGPGARPMYPAWAHTIRDQCEAAGVPFHFKQWGEHVTPSEMPDETFRAWEAGGGQSATDAPQRVGKRSAGRLLDGRVHDAFPDLDSTTTRSA